MKTRSTQITHSLATTTTTLCSRTVAGSMELSSLHPTCPACELASKRRFLGQLENRWSMGHPDASIKAEIDRLRGELKAVAA